MYFVMEADTVVYSSDLLTPLKEQTTISSKLWECWQLTALW